MADKRVSHLGRIGISGEFHSNKSSAVMLFTKYTKWGGHPSSTDNLPEPPPSSQCGQESTVGMHHAKPSTEPAQPAVVFEADTSLLTDELLVLAPRTLVQGKRLPTLGGILLLSKIAQGGMGAVYYGIHPRLDQEVAVKVLPWTLSRDPSAVQRFIREARLAFSVRSSHLITVIDVNEENGLFYLVMDYVAGETAYAYRRDAILRTGKPLPETIVLDICMGVAKGLEAAHRKSVIHRDIKPENILIPYTYCAPSQRSNKTPLNFHGSKLLDLGLARKEMRDKTAQRSNFTLGTPGFIAPEQSIDASTVGKPADIFGFGATMFAMLTGEVPARVPEKKTALKRTFKRACPPIRSLRPDLSPSVAALIDRCLALQPEDRPADASELIVEMRAVMREIDASYQGHYSGEWREPSGLRPMRDGDHQRGRFH